MNTNQKSTSEQTEVKEQDTKQLGLYNARADKQVSLKRLTATSDVLQAACLERTDGKQEWFITFLGQTIMKKSEARESMEELHQMTNSEILELCARMILINDAIKNQINNQNEQTGSATADARD